jgi:transposase
MYYPPAVYQKAQQLEQLLLRLEAGELLDQLCAELELDVSSERVSRLKDKYEAGGRTWEVLLDGRFGHSQHVNSAIRAYLFERKRVDEDVTAGKLAEEVAKKFKVQVSVGHINYILRQLALTRPPGRPRKRPTKDESSAPTEPAQAQGGVFFPGGGEATDGGDDGD